MKKLILLCLALLLIQGTCFAEDTTIKNGQKDIMDHIYFLDDKPLETQLNADLFAKFSTLYLESEPTGLSKERLKQFYFEKRVIIFSPIYRHISVVGTQIDITNNSDKPYILHWSKSFLSYGGFHGIPFISGMKYIDAGNPSATPDLLIPPKQTISQDIYISKTRFIAGEWSFDGYLIPTNNTMNIKLYLNIAEGNNDPQYYTIESPHIGI